MSLAREGTWETAIVGGQPVHTWSGLASSVTFCWFDMLSIQRRSSAQFSYNIQLFQLLLPFYQLEAPYLKKLCEFQRSVFNILLSIKCLEVTVVNWSFGNNLWGYACTDKGLSVLRLFIFSRGVVLSFNCFFIPCEL